MTANGTPDEFGNRKSHVHKESITPRQDSPRMAGQCNESRELQEEKTMSFSEIQAEDHPDLSQYRILNSIASPGRTDILSDRRRDRSIVVNEVADDEANAPLEEEEDDQNQTDSHEGSLPTSTCKSDLEEHGEQHAELPKLQAMDPDMFQRLKDGADQRPSILSQNSLPPFQGELPVKSMDVSEMGFRERY